MQEENHFQNSEKRKFRRKISKSWFNGVCSGLGEYFGINVAVFRIAFVVTSFFSGLGIAVYLLLLLVMPPEDLSSFEKDEREKITGNNFKSIIGTLLVISGFYFAFATSSIISYFSFFGELLSNLTPWFIILLGVILFKHNSEFSQRNHRPLTNLKKSITDNRLTGVCGGIANYLEIDSTVVRMFWIFTVFATLGITLLLYLFLALYLPKYEGVKILDQQQ